MHWYLIKNEAVKNVIVADQAFIDLYTGTWMFDIAINATTVPSPAPDIGWGYVDGVFIDPNLPSGG